MPHANILIVDESLIRWSLMERLESEGYDVSEAASANEALERSSCYRTEKFGLPRAQPNPS